MDRCRSGEARRDLTDLIEQVHHDHFEVEIASEIGPVVLMAKGEYDALVETSYLRGSR
ncbi:type II toxin-antitoxin system prevent-host-death family antitoxin [Arthrobacter alpinus]|uniref:type II toxin-antitoxin system prevent-host-death family antitoxin n=1 Tax=Arthrobacter alpinus TaxID=656366 RepID=UPI000A8C358F